MGGTLVKTERNHGSCQIVMDWYWSLVSESWTTLVRGWGQGKLGEGVRELSVIFNF